MSPRRYLTAAVCIIWLAFSLRTFDLYSLPLYHDEGDHLRWSQFIASGSANYPLFMDGKLGLGLLVSRFQVNGPNSIWVARAAVAIASMLTCAAVLSAGASLGGPWVSLLAGLIYAMLPWAVFYDRMILADPVEAAFGAVAAAATLRLARSWSWRWAVLAGLVLALSFTAKFYGLLFFVYPPLAVVVYLRNWRDWRRVVPRAAAALALAGLCLGAIFLALRPMIGYDNGLMAKQQVGHITCPPLLCQGDFAKQFGYYDVAVRGLQEFVPVYAGWPLAGLALLAVFVAPAAARRGALLVSGATALMLLGFSSVAYQLPARYLTFLCLPLSTLGAAGAVWIVQRLRPRPLAAAAGLALAGLTAWPLPNLAVMLARPDQAALPYDDRVNFISGPISGTYMLQAARDIMAAQKPGEPAPVLVFAHGFKEQLNQILVHFDVTQVHAVVIDDVRLRDVGGWLLAGTPVYIFDAIKADPNVFPGQPGLYPGMVVRDFARYPHYNWTEFMRVQRLTGADPDLRGKLFADYFIRPNEVASVYAAAAGDLPAGTDLALAMYPPSQAATFGPLLAGKSQAALYPIGDSWPLDVPAAEAELAAIAAQHAEVRVAFLGETIGDPGRRLETWLNTHLYRLDETWYKPLRMLDYLSAPDPGRQIGADIAFDGDIRLASIRLAGDPVPPGGALRVQLVWTAAGPLTAQYKVFVHVFAGDKIAAQHDGQPAGELRPTDTWKPGETIVDQFAIRIPADAKPGDYQLRVGLYDAASQERLGLADGSDFFVGGTVAIR